jgi:hypothetical protein
MNFIIENYAQLFAIAVPVLTLAGLNLFLALGGERGTLLLPSAALFEMASRPAAANAVPANVPAELPKAPANDPDFRRAA